MSRLALWLSFGLLCAGPAQAAPPAWKKSSSLKDYASRIEMASQRAARLAVDKPTVKNLVRAGVLKNSARQARSMTAAEFAALKGTMAPAAPAEPAISIKTFDSKNQHWSDPAYVHVVAEGSMSDMLTKQAAILARIGQYTLPWYNQPTVEIAKLPNGKASLTYYYAIQDNGIVNAMKGDVGGILAQ